MAVPGLSGSNGGVSSNQVELPTSELNYLSLKNKYSIPLDVSYFINNECNLKCKHCYVGYNNIENHLTLAEWEKLFEELIDLGALTFGNVGKEPTLAWDKTIHLLKFLRAKRKQLEKIRFGLVTNGILLDNNKINVLNEIEPDYVDISLDGDRETHDIVRGKGTFDKLIKNLDIISNTKLLDNIFIIFTINKLTINNISNTIKFLDDLGIKNILLSPYITIKKNDPLYISNSEFCNLFRSIKNGSLIDFNKYSNLTIYIKNDFSTTSQLMSDMVSSKIIELDNLLIDDYGVIFNKFRMGSNNLIFSYIPFNNNYKQLLRFSHDGYLSTCLDMFYCNYSERAIGNVRSSSISNLLNNINLKPIGLKEIETTCF
ncbi:MAG: radical SAM protein [Rhodothermaceae bacterium]